MKRSLIIVTCLMGLLAGLRAESVTLYREADKTSKVVGLVQDDAPVLSGAAPVFDDTLRAQGWYWASRKGTYTGYVDPLMVQKDLSVKPGSAVRVAPDQASVSFTVVRTGDPVEIVDVQEWVQIRISKAVPVYFLKPSARWTPPPEAQVVKAPEPKPKASPEPVTAEPEMAEEVAQQAPAVAEAKPEPKPEAANVSDVPAPEGAKDETPPTELSALSEPEDFPEGGLSIEAIAAGNSEGHVATLPEVPHANEPMKAAAPVAPETPEVPANQPVETTPAPSRLESMPAGSVEIEESGAPAMMTAPEGEEGVMIMQVEEDVQSPAPMPEPTAPAPQKNLSVAPAIPQHELVGGPANLPRTQQLPQRYVGTFREARGGMFSKAPFPFMVVNANGTPIAYVSKGNLIAPKPLTYYLDRIVVVRGPAERIDNNPGVVVHARTIKIER